MKPFAEQAGVTPVTKLDSEYQQKFDVLSKMGEWTSTGLIRREPRRIIT
ncbi:hypothetical protein [Terriglobus roseus]|nr:hypothetical protein [Terriglobus roseus]